MPKRKSDELDRIKSKIRKLEKKLMRKRRRSRNHDCSDSDDSNSSTIARSNQYSPVPHGKC